MPRVEAWYAEFGFKPAELLVTLSEIVPAGMTSPMGRLDPNCIKFKPVPLPRQYLGGDDAFIDIEAFSYADRENLDERAGDIKTALETVFPGRVFSVWPKLVKAGWAAGNPDPEFDGDMSMDAAVARAKARLIRVISG